MPRTLTNAHELLDAVKEHLDITEDGLLANALSVQPSCISKIRNGTNKVSAQMILKIHLLTRVPVEELLEYCPDDDIV
jgi:plasmid maintenance system antidote protein VapI